MKQSLLGSGAPKNRSIDVGANLLGEWIAEQTQLRREILRYGVVLGAVVVLGSIAVPMVWNAGTEASTRIGRLKAGVAQLDAQLAITDKAKKEAQPALVVEQMCGRTRTSFDFLILETERVLRAGNPHMVLSGVRADTSAGEIHLVVQAFAEDEGAIDAFARDVTDVSSKVDAVTNSRPSSLLARDGLSFEYVKRIEVPK